MRTIPESGAYRDVPVSVSPIIADRKTIAAIGVVDVVETSICQRFSVLMQT